jgi:TonB family protein
MVNMVSPVPNRTLLLALTIGGLCQYLWVGSCGSVLGAPSSTQRVSSTHKTSAPPKAASSKAPAATASKPSTSATAAPAPKAGGKIAGKTDNIHNAAVPNPNDPDFKLNASKTDSVNSAVGTFGSLGAGDVAPAPVTFDKKFDMLVTPKPKEETPQVDVASAKKAAVDKTAELQAAEASSVDWSGWAGQLADRWFSNLKNLEYSSHRGWTTDQPAMIQFTCHADGRITGIQVRQSCGNTAYDNMQIEALKRTIPAPPFPAGTHLTSYTLIQGWEAHPRHPGEQDYKPGSFGQHMPAEKVPLKKPVAGTKS